MRIYLFHFIYFERVEYTAPTDVFGIFLYMELLWTDLSLETLKQWIAAVDLQNWRLRYSNAINFSQSKYSTPPLLCVYVCPLIHTTHHELQSTSYTCSCIVQLLNLTSEKIAQQCNCQIFLKKVFINNFLPSTLMACILIIL